MFLCVLPSALHANTNLIPNNQKWQSHSVYSLPTVTMLRTEIVPLIIKQMLSDSRNNDYNTTILAHSERLQHVFEHSYSSAS